MIGTELMRLFGDFLVNYQDISMDSPIQEHKNLINIYLKTVSITITTHKSDVIIIVKLLYRATSRTRYMAKSQRKNSFESTNSEIANVWLYRSR